MSSRLPLVYFPNKLLRELSIEVSNDHAEIQSLIDQLYFTMHAAPGVGLSAIQIGKPLRVFTVDVPKAQHGYGKEVYINPVIIEHSDKKVVEMEGCLSFPDQFAPVERSWSCVITYRNRDWVECTQECKGLLSIAVQHELDHLDGKLFIDHISRLRRSRITQNMKKRSKKNSRSSAL